LFREELLKMKEAWKRERTAQTPTQDLLFRQEPCERGSQQES
jgi:hypothetical protein